VEQYFGRGLVDTVNDFGKMGQKPVNPALLDYLADSFVKNGWSVKKLQKEILLSSVYRQSSDHREDLVSVDPENKLLAYFPRQRLDAEQMRDSLLYAAGLLEERWVVRRCSAGAGQFRQPQRVEGLRQPGRPASPQRLHLRAPQHAVSAARHLRLGQPAAGAWPPRSHHHCPAGAGPGQ
jgi:hypothetical protein